VYGYGYTISMNRIFSVLKPNSQGSDEATYTSVIPSAYPLAQFADNETYSVESGMTLWWAGAQESAIVGDAGTVKNLRVWHADHFGAFIYATHNLVIDGLVVQGDWPLFATNNAMDNGITFSDYAEMGLVIQNSDIRGTGSGIDFSVNSNYLSQTVQNTTFQTSRYDMGAGQIWSVSDDNRGLGGRVMYSINNTHMIPPGFTSNHISYWESYGDKANLTVGDTFYVYALNGVPNANYRLYHKGQRPDAIFEKSVPGYGGLPALRIVACPAEKSPGVPYTNAECFANTGVSRNGAISPCIDAACSNAVSVPGVYGDLFPANLAATMVILSPSENQILSGNQAPITYQLFGDISQAASAKLSLDGGAFVTDSDLDGRYTFTNVVPGTHTLIAYLATASQAEIANTRITRHFRTTMNQFPVVNAGANQTVNANQQFTLNGAATDDGQPNPPAAMTYAWSKVSGPGSVTFDTPNAKQTTARINQAGAYVLAFTANDGELQAAANVTITVNAVGGNGGGDNGGSGGGDSALAGKKGAFHPLNGEVLDIPLCTAAEIFDRRGMLVQKLTGVSGSVTWDGRNSDGDMSPSGMYMSKCTGNGDSKKHQKFVLIK
jgi:hypothetical protein